MLRLAVVLVAVIGLCAGISNRPTAGYGDRPAPRHSGVPNNDYNYRPYGGYGHEQSFSFVNLERQLERIDTYLDNLETREADQVHRLSRLAQSANLNLDFRNNFENTIREQSVFHQQQQNNRIDDLDQSIARIRLIRERVLALTVDAEAIRTNLDEVVFPVNKQIASDILHLQHEDILRSNRITETQGRANAVNDGIDVLIDKALENTRTIYVLVRDIKAGIKSVNRERSLSHEEVVYAPASTSFDFVPPFDGSPQFAQTVLNGFHLIRDNYNHGYGYPSIYFGIATDLWNTKVDIDVSDMSTGGWDASSVSILGDYIYFDSNTLVLQSKNQVV